MAITGTDQENLEQVFGIYLNKEEALKLTLLEVLQGQRSKINARIARLEEELNGWRQEEALLTKGIEWEERFSKKR